MMTVVQACVIVSGSCSCTPLLPARCVWEEKGILYDGWMGEGGLDVDGASLCNRKPPCCRREEMEGEVEEKEERMVYASRGYLRITTLCYVLESKGNANSVSWTAFATAHTSTKIHQVRSTKVIILGAFTSSIRLDMSDVETLLLCYSVMVLTLLVTE